MKKFVFCTVIILALLVVGGTLGCTGFAPTQAVEHYNKGVALANESRYDEAIAEYNKAIELDPKCAQAYANRGYAYMSKGLSDLATGDFNKAIELSMDTDLTLYAKKMLENLTKTSPSVYTNPVVYQVTRTLTITNTDAQINLARVWIPSVVAWDSQTNITSIGTIPNPSNVWKDAQYGNSVLYWEFHNEPGKGSSVAIKDEFTYTCYQISYKVDPSKVGTYDKTSSDYQLFTHPEKYIESDDARIKEIAGQLQQDKTNPYTIAGSIYDWVMNNLTYRKVGGLKGAKFALENGYGECGACSYKTTCSGCRGRAYEETGDIMATDPGCRLVPEVARERGKQYGKTIWKG